MGGSLYMKQNSKLQVTFGMLGKSTGPSSGLPPPPPAFVGETHSHTLLALQISRSPFFFPSSLLITRNDGPEGREELRERTKPWIQDDCNDAFYHSDITCKAHARAYQ